MGKIILLTMQQDNKKHHNKLILSGLWTFNIPSMSHLNIDDSLKFITTQQNIPIDSDHFLDHDDEENHQSQEQDSLGIMLQKPQPGTSSGKKKRLGCTCKKTFCLKMYCECFSNCRTCNDECVCSQCKNVNENEKIIKEAKQNIKQKSIHSCNMIQKRCNCKKSFCQKKYCECFNSGVSCSESCKCVECYNRDIVSLKQKPLQSLQIQVVIRQPDEFLQKSMEDVQHHSRS